MKTGTVNISFQRDLLKEIDQAAKEESWTRSELIREAARIYLERKKRWKDIFAFGDRQASQQGLAEKDVVSEVKRYREAQKASRRR